MIRLSAKDNHPLSTLSHTHPFIAKITGNPHLPRALRAQYIFLSTEATAIPEGFGLVLVAHESDEGIYPVNTVRISQELRYLKEHDVIKFYPEDGKINVLYRKEANANSFLLTERCNSFCIMCSQPPRDVDDSYLVDDLLAAAARMDSSSPQKR